MIGWDDDAVWLESNHSIEWRLPWNRLAGIRPVLSEGIVSLSQGCELLDSSGHGYRLPVHWLAQFPKEAQEPLKLIASRIPEGGIPKPGSCVRHTTPKALRTLGLGAALTLFGLPSLALFSLSSAESFDPWLALTQLNALMAGVAFLALGVVDLIRAKTPRTSKRLLVRGSSV